MCPAWSGAITLGNKTFEGGTDGGGGLAAEHGFGGGIEHGDALVSVDCDDGIHSGADDGGEASFVFRDRVLDTTALGDVTSDFGSADNGTRGVAKRRDGDRHQNVLAIFTDTCGFKVTNSLASGNAVKNIDLFVDAVGRHKHAHGLADSLGCGITENTFGSSIPGGDGAIEGFADDGVVGIFDDRSETKIGAIRQPR